MLQAGNFKFPGQMIFQPRGFTTSAGPEVMPRNVSRSKATVALSGAAARNVAECRAQAGRRPSTRSYDSRRHGGHMARAADWRFTRMSDDETPPIFADKHYESPSVFTPESLLREARRQKSTSIQSVPEVCLLDPDGDIVRRLQAEGRARRHDGWVCYHTDLHVFEEAGLTIGVVGCVVGASFAVLVAEELFASGCALLLSLTSAGQITPVQAPPYFILIDRALRDEGTSYHYLPPARYSDAPGALIDNLEGAFDGTGIAMLRGATWTTDAPFRETQEAILSMRQRGLLAVEMEAAALYAFAKARGRAVVCFAQVTNHMGQVEGDFEKGHADGATDALSVVVTAAKRHLGID
jgi:uridine phosphorylase